MTLNNILHNLLKPQASRSAMSMRIGDRVRLIKRDSQSYQYPTNVSMTVTTIYTFAEDQGNLIGCRWQELNDGEIVNRTSLFPGSWLVKI